MCLCQPFSSDQECPLKWTSLLSHLPCFGSYGWAVLENTNCMSFKWNLSGITFPRLPLWHSSHSRTWTPQGQTRLIHSKSPWSVGILGVRSSVLAVLLYRSTPTCPLYLLMQADSPGEPKGQAFQAPPFNASFIAVNFWKFQGWNSAMLKTFGHFFRCICAS